jgi:hypothetical protein
MDALRAGIDRKPGRSGRIRLGIERNMSESMHSPEFPDELSAHGQAIDLHQNTHYGLGRLRSIMA